MEKALTLLCTALIVVSIFSMFTLEVKTEESHVANALWINPSNITLVNVGDKFNVTVWVNLIDNSFTWQVKLLFDSMYLDATRAGCTAGFVSDWATHRTGGVTTPVSPVIDNTKGYVLHGESCVGVYYVPGPVVASLMWVEFKLKKIPPTDLEINFSKPYGEDTFILNPGLDVIPISSIKGAKIKVIAAKTSLKVGNVTGYVNETVTVPVSIINASNVAGVQFTLWWGRMVTLCPFVQALNVRKTDLTQGFLLEYEIDNMVAVVKVAMASATGINGTGPIVLIDFAILGGPMPQWTIPLELVNVTLSDVNGKLVPCSVINGSITIMPPPEPGDANEDRVVDVRDVVLVLRYIIGKAELTPAGKKAADMNGDGEITVRDAVLILRKIVRGT
jgi:hypothetical protein